MDFTEIEETETKVLTISFIQLIKQMNEQAYENEAALAVEESAEANEENLPENIGR